MFRMQECGIYLFLNDKMTSHIDKTVLVYIVYSVPFNYLLSH